MIIEKLMRENIRKLSPYTSARDSFLEGILLDANENSQGSVWDEFERLNRYPDPNHNELRKVVGEFYGVNKTSLFFGVGSDEIIDLLIRIFCTPALDSVMVTAPSYGMYSVACHVNDVKVKEVELTDDFQLDIPKMFSLWDNNTKIVYLCSPNNPTGNLLKREDILTLCDRLESIIVVDEAYIDFCEEESLVDEISNHANLIILRTFSKAWGMAGLRCGYAIANQILIETLYKVKAPYNLNTITQLGIIKAVNNYRKKNEFINSIIAERKYLINELNKIDGVERVFESDANFLIFQVEEPDRVYEALVGKTVIIRNRSKMPKIKGCLRVTVGNKEENKIFLRELRNIL